MDLWILPSWLNPMVDKRRRRFWLLGGIAFLLHVVLDPFTTYLSVRVYGVALETNPLLIEPLRQGLRSFILIHLPLIALLGIVFVGLLWLLHIGSPAEAAWVARFSTIVWILIILWGILVVANNLFVLVSGLT